MALVLKHFANADIQAPFGLNRRCAVCCSLSKRAARISRWGCQLRADRAVPAAASGPASAPPVSAACSAPASLAQALQQRRRYHQRDRQAAPRARTTHMAAPGPQPARPRRRRPQLLPLLALALALAAPALVSGRDFYDLLNVPKHASDSVIKRSYRKLALKYHPDKVTGTDAEKADAAKHFADINHAYETLSDPEKRRVYDSYGEEGLKQHAAQQGGGAGGNGGGFFDFFFGGGGGGFGGGEEERTPKGQDVVVDLFVTLRDLYVGREVTTVRDKPVLVPAPGTRQCKCRQKLITRQLGPGMFQQFAQNVCEECPAVKLEREKDSITVHVEPGMVDGHEVTFFEEGEPLVDGEPGDLRFKLRTLPHATFRRAGADLAMARTISLVDALVGFRHEIEHLDGHKVVLAADGVTRPGDVQRVPGEGMPVFDSSAHGDLLVTYSVDFPAALSAEQKEAVRKLFGGSDGAAAAAA